MSKSEKTIKTLFMIFFIALLTYAMMAVITHFSLNYQLPNYKFTQSLISIFDFSTDIFKFFIGFILINIIWISLAILIFYITKLIRR